MEHDIYIAGNIYISRMHSGAVTLDLDLAGSGTITYADHKYIEKGRILIMIRYLDLGNSGIWVWYYKNQKVWQIMEKNKFSKYWKKFDQSKICRDLIR